MAILSGDLKLVESQVMEDVPEGGGGPTANVIVDGASNNIFPDISELDRAGGRVNLRKVVVHVQTDNRDTFLGGNFIVAEPPNDPNVSITVFSTGETFDLRSDAADRIEQYLVKGPVWNGYLLENHVAGQRSIQLFQRPGAAQPAIGRTLALVTDENLVSEVVQYVRVTRVESVTTTYSDANGTYQGDVVTCDISDSLRTAFLGSPPSRYYQAAAGKALLRDTTVADAGNYHGVVPLTVAAELGDTAVQVESVYTQLVPSARTETIAIDQRPGGQRTLTLATTPRLVEVGVTPHSTRLRVGQENRGFSWVQILRPLPAPNTLVISYRALGTWYTVQDDGAGALTGAGVGTVNYSNGSVSLTTPALPDVGSTIVYSWGESVGFTDRTGAVTFRPPEIAFELPNRPIKPGTLTTSWASGGVTKTVTDNGAGRLTGHGVGEVDYASGRIFLRPSAMIDPMGEFYNEYEYTSEVTENVPAPTLDSGGFATISLDQTPLAGTVRVRWLTTRSVSQSSGTSTIVTSSVTTGDDSGKGPVITEGSRSGLRVVSGPMVGATVAPGATLEFELQLWNGPGGTPYPEGVYDWGLYTAPNSIGGPPTITPTSGTVTLVADADEDFVSGRFSLTVDASSTGGLFSVHVDHYIGIMTVAVSSMIFVIPGGGAALPPSEPPGPPAVEGEPKMFNGGHLEGSTTPVWVSVPPTLDPTFGYYYNIPSNQPPHAWTPAEVTAGEAEMQSIAGAAVSYRIWGA